MTLFQFKMYINPEQDEVDWDSMGMERPADELQEKTAYYHPQLVNGIWPLEGESYVELENGQLVKSPESPRKLSKRLQEVITRNEADRCNRCCRNCH